MSLNILQTQLPYLRSSLFFTDHYCCGEDYISENLQCCAGEPYNRSKSYCERNTILAFGEGICGSQIYNVSHQKCCGISTLHNVLEADKQYRCCGSELYNNNTSQCCKPENIVQNLTGQCCGKGDHYKSIEKLRFSTLISVSL